MPKNKDNVRRPATKRRKKVVTAPVTPIAAEEPEAPTLAAVLDDSSEGSPFIPGGPDGLIADVGLPPAGEELIIEVELAPGAAPMADALTSNTAAFLGGEAAGTAAADSALRTILQRFGARDARPVFTGQQVREDEARTASLRSAAALGAASLEQVSALERLPSLSSYVRLSFPPGTSPSEVTTALKRLPEVARAVAVPRATPPMMISTAQPLPTDPLIGSGSGPITTDPTTDLETQWYLHRTRVLSAWRFTRGSNVVVADVDWGYRTSHQEFKDAIEKTYNAFDGGTDVTKGAHAAHGTAVLGIAGARGDGVGIAGYAPEAALWAVQGDSGPGAAKFQEPWAEAIDFVRRTDSGKRRKVIILEVQTGIGGNYEQIPSVHRAVRAAIADRCVVCVAAGNGSRAADRSDDGQPFDPTGSILVGATIHDELVNKRAPFSNFGSRVVVSAPGDPRHDVTCAQSANNAYRNGFGGTSGATPKVAGTAALMLSVNPDLSHGDVRDILAGTGTPLSSEPGKPAGVFLNTEAAVAEALQRRSESLPGEPVFTPAGQPAPEPLPSTSIYGIRRRTSQIVLPQDLSSPISWNTGPAEEAHPALGDAAVRGETPPAGDKTLRTFRESVAGALTQQDRILIVAQAIAILDNFYVHRVLKEAIHAVRPIQGLRVLQRRMEKQSDIPIEERDELAFHNTLTQIFNSVRDLHTNYLLPRPYRDYIAYLPFEVAHFYENDRRRYLVTRVVPGYTFGDPDFGPGAELLYWNGSAIERAVRSNADQTAGSNDAARHARGVSSLTIRPMNTALPPSADFVDLDFVPAGASADDLAMRHRMRQTWFVRFAPPLGGASAPAAAPPPAAGPSIRAMAPHSSIDLARESTARSAEALFGAAPGGTPPDPTPASPPPDSRSLAFSALLGLDSAADAVREARQLIFDSAALRGLQGANVGDQIAGIRASASPSSAGPDVSGSEITVKVPWNAAFRARTVDFNGKRYGYIHIRTFYVPDADGFVNEFIRLLQQLPEHGLILDVRGNGGGNIWASERLLQTLTAPQIEPERLQFVVSQGTLELCRNNPEGAQIPLNLWQPSLEGAVETGSMYSQAFPLTAPESCNALGQQYYGPVVLLVDGNCYSATDIFAAGFQDHEVGKIIGVSAATGAGGANVWEHWLLNQVLPTGWGLKPLPNEASMRVAIRQCLRVGPRAGALLEDFGVVPDSVHKLTRKDVMEEDRDLLQHAAEHLSKKPIRSIKVVPGVMHEGKRSVTIRTHGLKRLDIFLDDRPQGSPNLEPDAAGNASVEAQIQTGARLQLFGFAERTGSRPDAGLKQRVS